MVIKLRRMRLTKHAAMMHEKCERHAKFWPEALKGSFMWWISV